MTLTMDRALKLIVTMSEYLVELVEENKQLRKELKETKSNVNFEQPVYGEKNIRPV